MEPSSKKVINVEKTHLMRTFWNLAEGHIETRIHACFELLAILKKCQGKEEKLCDELEYTIIRLISGLASNRKWARLGFSTALTQVLRAYPTVLTSQVLTTIRDKLKIQITDSKSEKSDKILGRVMACLCLAQSDRVPEADGSEVEQIVTILKDAQCEKVPLHLVCTQTLVQIVAQTPEQLLRDHVWPQLQTQLQAGWATCTPDTLLLLLTVIKHHKDVVSKTFLETYWGCKKLLSERNFSNIAQIMIHSTREHPILHEVCPQLLQRAFKKSDVLETFWNQVIDNTLMKSNVKCVYLVFHLVSKALQLAQTSDQVEMVLSTAVLDYLHRSQARTDILHEAGKKLLQDLCDFVRENSDPRMQSAVLKRLFVGKVITMELTKVTTAMVQSLKSEAAQEWTEMLIGRVIGSEAASSDMIDETERCWAGSQLASAITVTSMASNLSWQANILKCLCLHSFFELQTTNKKLAHCNTPVQAMSKNLRKHLQNSFFRALDRLAVISPGVEKHQGHRRYIDVLYELSHYVNAILSKTKVAQLCQPLTEEVKEEWDRVSTLVEEIHSKRMEAAMSHHLAFELLFLQLGLQLLKEPGTAVDTLKDLHICYEKAVGKTKKHSSKSEDIEEPSWVEVITDALMGLLSQNSHLLRVVVNKAFLMLCPHLNKAALGLILEVLEPGTEADDQGPLGFEDDNEEEMEVNKDNEDENEESSESEEEEEEEESDSSSDEETAVVDENLRNHLQAALGKAAVASDEEDEASDLNDEEMFKLDEALAVAFKQMKKSKKQTKEEMLQVLHYKQRCMDLLNALVKSNPPTSTLLELIKPLLAMVEAGYKDKAIKEQGARAANILSRIYQSGKLAEDSSLKKGELPEFVDDLIEYSKKVSGVAMVKEVASACLFVIKVLVSSVCHGASSPAETRTQLAKLAIACKNKTHKSKDSKHVGKVVDVIRKGVVDFCGKRDIYLNPTLFHTILTRQPLLFWPLAEDLLQMLIEADLRVFTKTHVCSMISTLIHKDNLNVLQDDWKPFATELVSHIYQTVTNMDEENIKPRYVYELLFLLQRTISISDEQIKHSIPEAFVEKLNAIKTREKRKDTKTLCNRILNFVKTEKSPKKQEGKRKSKGSDPSENVTKKPKLSNGNAIQEEVSSPKSKKSKKRRKSINEKEDDKDQTFTSLVSPSRALTSPTKLGKQKENKDTPDRSQAAKTPVHLKKTKSPKLKSPTNTPKVNTIESTQLMKTPKSRVKTPAKSSKKSPKVTPGKT